MLEDAASLGSRISTNVSAPSRRRGLLLSDSTVLALLFCVIFLQWPLAAVSRIVGAYTGFEPLTENILGDALSFACALSAALIGAILDVRRRIRPTMATACICSFGLVLIQVLMGAVNVVVADAWNTPVTEFLRSLTLLSIYIAFASLSRNSRAISWSKLRRYCWLYLVFCLIGLVITIFQSVELLPNFFFQWFDGRRLVRPAGGLAHPHYYAVITSLGLILTAILRRKNGLGITGAVVLTVLLLTGVVLSTSRVGLIVAAVSLLFVGKDLLGIRRADFAGMVLLGILLLLIVAVVYLGSGRGIGTGSSGFDVFFSFMSSDETDVFRGRQAAWSVEIDYITKDVVHFLFGYGYQPYVSHNLLFRQAQVTGVIGAILYFAILVSTFTRGYHLSAARFRNLAAAVIWGVVLSSFLFPILISQLTLTAALLVLAMVGISSRSE